MSEVESLLVVVAAAAVAVTATVLWLLRRERRRSRLATLDPLTQLGNRALLTEAAARMFRSLKSVEDGDGSRGPALLVLDLDSFKDVNDVLGHTAGDAVLVQVAALLRAAAGPHAVVVRLGGDEFAVLLPGTLTAEQVVLQAKKMLAGLGAGEFGAHGVSLEVRASIGITQAPRDGRDLEELLSRAVVALNEAKRARTGVQLYDYTLDPHRGDHLGALSLLRAAMDDGQLHLRYQPLVDADTFRPVGFEALIRWEHPTRGLMLPAEFIPLAEMTNLIHPLTRWVMRTALREAAGWREQGMDLTIAVNISASTLEDGLLGIVEEALALTRWPAARLILEITESAITLNPDVARSVVEKLRARGVRVSVDDFGAGFTSLGLLGGLAVHELKIDRQFVNGLGQPQHNAIVSSIIELGHRLGMVVVAEGVEVNKAALQLAELGVDVLQGYHFARPMVAAEVPGWATERGVRRISGTAVDTAALA